MYIYFATEILRKHYDVLVGVIQDPATLAASLFAKGIIAGAVRDKVQQSVHLSTKDKNAILINAVADQLSVKPSVFQVFMEILDKEAYLSDCVKKMRGVCVCVCMCVCVCVCVCVLQN